MDWRVQPMQGPPRFCCETLGFSRAFSLGYSAVAADLPVPAAVQRSVAKLLDLELGRATLDPAKQNRSRPRGGVLPTEMVALACQGGAAMGVSWEHLHRKPRICP